jgi:hypothetical protein
MQKKVTISLDEKIYYELCQILGNRKINQFIEELVKSHVIYRDLDDAYKEMAADKSREQEALEWTEATFGDSVNETW